MAERYLIVGSLGAGPVSDAVAAPIAANTLIGNNTSGTAFPSALTTAQVLTMLGLSAVLKFKGSTDCSGNPNYPAATAGDAYVVTVAGKIGGAAGVVVEVGDVYFATADNAGGTQAAVGASWDVLQANLAGITAAGLAMIQGADAPAQTALLTAFTGDSGAGGVKGLVPAPAAGDAAAGKVLGAGGAWVVPAGGSGLTYTEIAQASRTEYTAWTGASTFDTVADAQLTGAGAVMAYCYVELDLSDTSATPGDYSEIQVCARATGSGDTFGNTSGLIYNELTVQVAAITNQSDNSFRCLLPCGTGGNAGKFDIAVNDAGLNASAAYTLRIVPLGYLA